MHPRTPCFFGLWVLLSLLEAARVADAMIEARQTFAKSRPLLPWGNYKDILDLLQEVDYACNTLPRASGRLWCVLQVFALFSYGRLTIDTPSPSCRIAPSNCIASTGLVRQKVYPRAWHGHDRRRPPESYPDVPGTWRVSFHVLSAGLGTGARADGLPG